MDFMYERIQSLYTALGIVDNSSPSAFQGQTFITNKSVLVVNDFSGGATQAQLRNDAEQLIGHIAHLEYHLKKWAANNQRSTDRVDWHFKHNPDLSIIHDLSNNSKHGYPRQTGRDRSPDRPRLVDFERGLRLATKPRENSSVSIQLPIGRPPRISGDGRASVVTTAKVLRQDGSLIGDLHEILLRGIEAVEVLMNDIGCLILVGGPTK